MPTGYTSVIADGTCTFEQFAMRCARNFGATVSMREESADAPIPIEFSPADYYLLNLRMALARLDTLRNLSPRTYAAHARTEREEALERYRNRVYDRVLQRKNYEAMLEKIEAWTPPTTDHGALKDFMLQQVRDSLKHDCDDSYDRPPPRITGKQWFATEMRDATNDLARTSRSYAEAFERTKRATEWVQALRESLGNSSSVTVTWSAPK